VGFFIPFLPGSRRHSTCDKELPVTPVGIPPPAWIFALMMLARPRGRPLSLFRRRSSSPPPPEFLVLQIDGGMGDPSFGIGAILTPLDYAWSVGFFARRILRIECLTSSTFRDLLDGLHCGGPRVRVAVIGFTVVVPDVVLACGGPQRNLRDVVQVFFSPAS